MHGDVHGYMDGGQLCISHIHTPGVNPPAYVYRPLAGDIKSDKYRLVYCIFSSHLKDHGDV